MKLKRPLFYIPLFMLMIFILTGINCADHLIKSNKTISLWHNYVLDEEIALFQQFADEYMKKIRM
jgi:hypothetical protein